MKFIIDGKVCEVKSVPNELVNNMADGVAGQVLAKKTDSNYDFEWMDLPDNDEPAIVYRIDPAGIQLGGAWYRVGKFTLSTAFDSGNGVVLVSLHNNNDNGMEGYTLFSASPSSSVRGYTVLQNSTNSSGVRAVTKARFIGPGVDSNDVYLDIYLDKSGLTYINGYVITNLEYTSTDMYRVTSDFPNSWSYEIDLSEPTSNGKVLTSEDLNSNDEPVYTNDWPGKVNKTLQVGPNTYRFMQKLTLSNYRMESAAMLRDTIVNIPHKCDAVHVFANTNDLSVSGGNVALGVHSMFPGFIGTTPYYLGFATNESSQSNDEYTSIYILGWNVTMSGSAITLNGSINIYVEYTIHTESTDPEPEPS